MAKFSHIPVLVMALLLAPAAYAAESPAAQQAVKEPALARPAMQPVLDTGSIAQLATSLVLVVALIIVLAWLYRRFGGGQLAQSGIMKIVAGISLGARERVVLMQVGEQQVLLGVSPGRVQMLCSLDKPVTVAEAAALKGESFAERFAEAMKRNLRK